MKLFASILIFVIVGQSNASGWAAFPLTPPSPLGVIVFGNDYQYHQLDPFSPIDSPTGQMDSASLDLLAGYGFAAAFAERIVSETGAQVVLIPCAKGGSSVSEWQQGEPLYTTCLDRIRQVTGYYGLPLAGVLYNQGERDTTRSYLAARWKERFETFVTDLRTDLTYSVPVLYAQLGNQFSRLNWLMVRDGQAGVVLPAVTMITTSDILDTALHYTTWETTLVGRRYANQWLRLYP